MIQSNAKVDRNKTPYYDRWPDEFQYDSIYARITYNNHLSLVVRYSYARYERRGRRIARDDMNAGERAANSEYIQSSFRTSSSRVLFKISILSVRTMCEQ